MADPCSSPSDNAGGSSPRNLLITSDRTGSWTRTSVLRGFRRRRHRETDMSAVQRVPRFPPHARIVVRQDPSSLSVSWTVASFG